MVAFLKQFKLPDLASPFRPKNTALVGIDIGSASLKLLELTKTDSGYTVEHYAIVPLPDDVIVEKEIKNVDVLHEALLNLIDQANTRSKNTAIAMPSSLVIIKVIQIDAELTAYDLEEQIPIDASRYIPYPLEEVSLDYEIWGTNKKDETKIDVLIAASRTEQVESRVDVLEELGMNVKIVDVESYAIERAYAFLAEDLQIKSETATKESPTHSAENNLIAIINIGAAVTSLTVIQNSSIIYTRDEAFGGKQLTDHIKSRFELPTELAESGKRLGNLPPEYTAEVLEPFIESVATQISHSLQFFYSAMSGEIKHIILAGGVASLPNLPALIKEKTGIDTSIANPFKNMKINSRIDKEQLQKDAPTMVIACGLALRSFK